jgi:flap endonuclease-1
MWQNIIKESKQLLGALGVPYINSPASAESQCAYLVNKGFVDYANSQDFDSLLFGAKKLVQNLSKSLRRKIQGKWQYKKIQPFLIDLQKNLKNLGITIFQLIDIGILIGTDYFQGIYGIGPKRALTLIRRYKTLENLILKEYDGYDFRALNPSIIKRIRNIFLFPDVTKSFDNLLWNPLNRMDVLSLLCQEHNLNKDRVEKSLEKLEKNYRLCRNYFIHKEKQPKRHQITLDNLF